jgi:tetratricopeptide (TPR) repeat protein
VAQQVITGAFQEVPAAIEKLHAEASAADDRGERQKALALQQEVMTWVKANLLTVHPFRAKALNRLGIYLSKMGQRAEALPPTLEAVKIRRELAKTNSAFLPDLASALNNLGVFYSELGQRAEALPPTLEAVNTYRELAKTNSAFLPNLAGALNNLGVRYRELGQRAEALPPTLEAVKTYRELAKTNSSFLPDLAGALGNLGLQYSTLNQLDEAFPHAEEAVRLYTELVSTYPARFKDDLQRARNNLEDLRRKEDLQLGRKREIAPSDRTYLNTNDPNTPLRRSVVRIWPTFSGTRSGIGLLGTGFVVRREGDRAWIATARHVVLDPGNSAPPTKVEAELYSGALPPTLTTTRLSVVLPSAAESDASSGDDLILLEVKGLPADVAPLPMESEPPRGALKVVGHPNGQDPWMVVTMKLVADLFDPTSRVFRLSGPIDEGASGAPVLNSSDRVVGLVRTRTKIDDNLFVISAYRAAAIQAKMPQLVPARHGSRSSP